MGERKHFFNFVQAQVEAFPSVLLVLWTDSVRGDFCADFGPSSERWLLPVAGINQIGDEALTKGDGGSPSVHCPAPDCAKGGNFFSYRACLNAGATPLLLASLVDVILQRAGFG